MHIVVVYVYVNFIYIYIYIYIYTHTMCVYMSPIGSVFLENPDIHEGTRRRDKQVIRDRGSEIQEIGNLLE